MSRKPGRAVGRAVRCHDAGREPAPVDVGPTVGGRHRRLAVGPVVVVVPSAVVVASRRSSSSSAASVVDDDAVVVVVPPRPPRPRPSSRRSPRATATRRRRGPGSGAGPVRRSIGPAEASSWRRVCRRPTTRSNRPSPRREPGSTMPRRSLPGARFGRHAHPLGRQDPHRGRPARPPPSGCPWCSQGPSTRCTGQRRTTITVHRSPGSAGEAAVRGDEGCFQRLSDGYVGGVIGADVVAELPDAAEQTPDPDPLDAEPAPDARGPRGSTGAPRLARPVREAPGRPLSRPDEDRRPRLTQLRPRLAIVEQAEHGRGRVDHDHRSARPASTVAHDDAASTPRSGRSPTGGVVVTDTR